MSNNGLKTDLSLDDAKSLVRQVQIAHRLSVGFYARLIPLLNELAKEIDENLMFWYWEPEETMPPPRASTAPNSRWTWDFFPLYAFSCVYRKAQGEGMSVKDSVVAFRIFIEDSFDSENRVSDGQPDPLTMPQGSARLLSYIYRPKKNSKAKLAGAFESAPWVAPIGNMESASEHLCAVGFEWPLELAISDPSLIVEAMRKHRN